MLEEPGGDSGGIQKLKEQTAKESERLWEEDTWPVWEAERQNTGASSTSHMNMDNECISHKLGHALEEGGKKI